MGAIQSNHCRATAVAAKYLNLDCYVILCTSKVLVDEDPGLTGNLLVERLVGAHVVLVSEEGDAKLGNVMLTDLLKERLLREGTICDSSWWIKPSWDVGRYRSNSGN